MKYALCLRGISYFNQYPYNNICEPFDIDFSDSIESFYKNIINPLRDNGHIVDIYFSTYNSDKLKDFEDIMKPKNKIIRDFVYILTGNNQVIYRGMIDCMSMLKDDNYDNIIIARFDTVIVENILNVYFPENSLSSITPRDDSFFVFSGNLLNILIYFFKEFSDRNILTHDYTTILTNNNIRCHTMYSDVKDQKKFPFYRFNRLVFNKKEHEFFRCNLQDFFDEKSDYYVYHYKNNKEFVSYVNPDL